MLPLWITLLVVLGGLVVLLYQGAAILFAYQLTRFGPDPPNPVNPAGRRVSVVVAARNEEADLGPTLDALMAQDYPDLEIVVVDGGSTDGTRAVIDARAPRVRGVTEPPLPPGWVGKNWGCWTGAGATDGPWLLFVDADVRLHPAAVRTTLAWAEREHADLATLGLQVEMVGFWERLVMPLFIARILTYLRPSHMDRPGSKTAMANGQFWLTRRATYEAQGGHAAVRGRVLEDVAIARRYREAGLRLRFAWTPSLGRTRMYRDRHEMFEGLLKNVHGLDFSAARQVRLLAEMIGMFLLPLGVLPLGLLTGNALLAGLGVLLYVALFGKHVAFAHAVGAPAVYGLLYPLGIGWYVALVATSLVRGIRRRPIAWKGRSYPLDGVPPPNC
ncbi:MAG: glycosyltransferase family A protein [Thermoplasmata archaeon]